jgi:hypothetical protein
MYSRMRERRACTKQLRVPMGVPVFPTLLPSKPGKSRIMGKTGNSLRFSVR